MFLYKFKGYVLSCLILAVLPSIEAHEIDDESASSECGPYQNLCCPSDDELTCDNFDVDAEQPCPTDCPDEDMVCLCKTGYRWSDTDQKCIPLASCPNFCGENATYQERGPMFPKRCKWPAVKLNVNPIVATRMMAQHVCVCKPGYLQNFNKDCVLEEDCPVELNCGENEEETFSGCPVTCENYMETHLECAESYMKMQRCTCIKNYALDTSKGVCVPFDKCVEPTEPPCEEDCEGGTTSEECDEDGCDESEECTEGDCDKSEECTEGDCDKSEECSESDCDKSEECTEDDCDKSEECTEGSCDKSEECTEGCHESEECTDCGEETDTEEETEAECSDCGEETDEETDQETPDEESEEESSDCHGEAASEEDNEECSDCGGNENGYDDNCAAGDCDEGYNDGPDPWTSDSSANNPIQPQGAFTGPGYPIFGPGPAAPAFVLHPVVHVVHHVARPVHHHSTVHHFVRHPASQTRPRYYAVVIHGSRPPLHPGHPGYLHRLLHHLLSGLTSHPATNSVAVQHSQQRWSYPVSFDPRSCPCPGILHMYNQCVMRYCRHLFRRNVLPNGYHWAVAR